MELSTELKQQILLKGKRKVMNLKLDLEKIVGFLMIVQIKRKLSKKDQIQEITMYSFPGKERTIKAKLKDGLDQDRLALVEVFITE